MPPIKVFEKDAVAESIASIYEQLNNRLALSALYSCPVEFLASFTKLCASQSCGKCTPCRTGLVQLSYLLDGILDGFATMETLDLIGELAEDIYSSSDCAIGYEAAAQVMRALAAFPESLTSHILEGICVEGAAPAVPCRSACPANVDIPGYLALAAAGRYADAIALVRKDNPFAIVCGLVCEHPCELECRRAVMDDAVNIRAIKRFCADNAEEPLPPTCADATGKRVAIVGGGPAGLSTAYFLALMGHSPTVFEQRKQLGGMLRYGIPAYRLPRVELDKEIDFLLSAGIEVECNCSVGTDISLDTLREEFDAVYLTIGAHTEKKLGLEGEDAEGVLSAMGLLRDVGDGEAPDLGGKDVIIVGGGNVAMDAARTALRFGAKSVNIVYRRRVQDMPAQKEEVHEAIAEGCAITDLMSPASIEVTDGKVSALIAKKQIASAIKNGRVGTKDAEGEPVRIPCDVLVLAIGQEVDTAVFKDYGLPVSGKGLVSSEDTSVEGFSGVFASGECVTGPATVIQTISAAKATAAAIDGFLGFSHEITCDVEVPAALCADRFYCARSETSQLDFHELSDAFSQTEVGLLKDAAAQESERCLRCDHFGLGAFRDGRYLSW